MRTPGDKNKVLLEEKLLVGTELFAHRMQAEIELGRHGGVLWPHDAHRRVRSPFFEKAQQFRQHNGIRVVTCLDGETSLRRRRIKSRGREQSFAERGEGLAQGGA